MKTRSPIVAMLWENWRLTRVEAAQRLGFGVIVASLAMLLLDTGATAAYWILLVVHCMFWLSISKLNGGRIVDGYKPGFPLRLLYTRPVPTFVLVGVAMAYDAISCTALYLSSAVLVGFAFGQPLPLFSVTVWLMTFHLVCTSVQWSTRNRVVQWVGTFAICSPLFWMLMDHRVESPLRVEFSLTENALMALLGLVAFGLTIAGVARQRYGGTVTGAPRNVGSSGYPDWLITLFRFACPTSSATRAQVWFELKSSGLPALSIGLATAIGIALLSAISIPFVPFRNFAVLAIFFSVPAVMLFFGGNAFGIRHKQGRTYLSAFDATQPYDSAQLAGLKMLVRTVCVLAALVVVGVSAWVSSSLISSWGEWMVNGKDASVGLLKFRRELDDGIFWEPTAYEHVLRVVLTSVAVAMMVASRAIFTALRACYTRRVNIAASSLLLAGLAFVLLVLGARNGIVSPFVFDAILATGRWIFLAAMVFTLVYVFWRGIAERVLTIRYVGGVFVISTAFLVAWLAVLHAAGVQLVGMPATNVVSMLWPVLLLPLVSVLAPWALSRIRQM